jgi:riboflavin kinase/FMN adenylyltransferase
MDRLKIIQSKAELADIPKGLALSIGNFDGVHLGHRKILSAGRDIVKSGNLPGLAVMAFEPHPIAVLHPESFAGLLTPLPLKSHLLEQNSADYLIILKDSYELLNLSPDNFIEQFLMKNISPSVLIEGVNFNFGYGRSGDIHTLEKLGTKFGFGCVIVPPLQVELTDGQKTMVSSSLIRNLLASGQVEDSAKALGRFYRLIGTIIPGRGKGAELGFPTANIQPAEQIIPAEGVYAGLVEIGDTFDTVCKLEEKLPAVFSIGRAKTFVTEQHLLTEAHILAEDVGKLHGKWLAMDVVAKIRNPQRFENEKALSKQIAKDCKTAKEILATMNTNK